MGNKRSAAGIAAGILFAVILVYEILSTIATVTTYPSITAVYLLLEIPYLTAQMFVIIALFMGQRSWLLLTAYGIQTIMTAWQMIARLLNGGKPFPGMCDEISVFLTGALVAFCCIPALERAAGWTGWVWFAPAILYKAAAFINFFHNMEIYWKLIKNDWASTVLPLLMDTVLPAAALLLFCLWLTDPVRHKAVN